MLTAGWCLLTVIGAWLTYRRTPFYSLKSALRSLGLTLLMIATAAAVIVLTIRAIDGRSVVVQSTALAIVVLLCTLGLIFGVSAVFTPAESRLTTALPPDAALVTLHRARILPWVRVVAAVLGASLLLMGVPGPVRYIAGSFAGMVSFLGLIMLPVAYVMARRSDRAVTALQLHPWLHWNYPPATWNAWIERLADLQATAEAVKMTPAARRWTIAIVTVVAALYTVFLVPASMAVRLGCGLASGLLVLGVALLTRTQPRHAAKRALKRLQTAPPDTFFGKDGVFCNGEFCTWRGIDVFLLSATIEPGPPRCIVFWFEKILPGAYGGPQVTRVRKDVLIAADAPPSDLTALQAALIGRCPDARITLA